MFYSFACFPKRDHPDLVDYVQAIPDILVFTNFLNDVLRFAHCKYHALPSSLIFLTLCSFYKEEMDGEQHNYCQMMSRVSGRPPVSVLEGVSRETVSVARRAEKILEDSPVALKAFKDYQQGYM